MKKIKDTTKFLILLCLAASSTSTFCQKQWFPEKIDSLTQTVNFDTTGTGLVSFIKEQNGKVSMYGRNTNYQTVMKPVNTRLHRANNLIFPIKTEDEESYANATYTFTIIDKKKARLTIQRIGKPKEEIDFILSSQKYKNINAKFG